MATAQFYDKGKVDALFDGISKEIQDALQYAVVVDDRLVPTEGPGTSVIEAFQSGVTTWLSAQLPGWASNANKNTAVFRNRPANNNYYYNCPDLLNRVVLWIGDVNKDEGQTAGYMERSLIFPKAGVYSVDVEYAVGITYQRANAPRFLVSIGDKTQEVVGTRQIGDLQKGHLLFSVQAGSGTIRLTATPGLGTAENAAAVVIASLKVTLVKEIGIEIGDIVAPDDNAQTGQAADAKATYEQLAGKASKSDATLTPIYSDTPTFSEWVCEPNIVTVYWDDFRAAWQTSPADSVNAHAEAYNPNATNIEFVLEADGGYVTATRTRTDIIGYTLGSQADKPLASIDPLLFARYYPEGNVKSAAEFTAGIQYDSPDTTNRTITVKPFCNTGDTANDNSNLAGRVVIPPFVGGDGNGYISDDGTRFKVVGVSGGSSIAYSANLTDIIAPNTVTTIGDLAFSQCISLISVSIPAAQTVGEEAFAECIALTTISLPATTSIGFNAFTYCTSLASVDFGDTPRPSVPTLGSGSFLNVPTSCKFIVPDNQYDAWIAADGWRDLVTAGYTFLRHSEWEYARKYEVDKKADRPTTFTTGNLAALDANGNPTDSGIKPSDKANKRAFTQNWEVRDWYEWMEGDWVWYNDLLYRATRDLEDDIDPDVDPDTPGEADKHKPGVTNAWERMDINDVQTIGGMHKAESFVAVDGAREIIHDVDGLACQEKGYGGIYFPRNDGMPRVVVSDEDYNERTYRFAPGHVDGEEVTVAITADLRYNLVTKTISNNAVTLDDRACNYVDARSLGSSDSLDIDFPALVDDKARDFVLAVECGANPPAISYAAFVTIMAEDASSLTPESGMNIYAFTEFKPNMFLASRKLITTVVDNSPENGDQLLLAMQKRGIDTTNITDFGGVAAALGLSDTATLQDAIDAVMN